MDTNSKLPGVRTDTPAFDAPPDAGALRQQGFLNRLHALEDGDVDAMCALAEAGEDQWQQASKLDLLSFFNKADMACMHAEAPQAMQLAKALREWMNKTEGLLPGESRTTCWGRLASLSVESDALKPHHKLQLLGPLLSDLSKAMMALNSEMETNGYSDEIAARAQSLQVVLTLACARQGALLEEFSRQLAEAAGRQAARLYKM